MRLFAGKFYILYYKNDNEYKLYFFRVPNSLLNAYQINLDEAKIEHENYVR